MSFTFGPEIVGAFLKKHDLDLVCRAHQVVEEGYEFFAGRQLVTVFSAPNYCGEFDNSGGMMTVDEQLMCSFRVLKPADKKQKFNYGGLNNGRPVTPPKTQVSLILLCRVCGTPSPVLSPLPTHNRPAIVSLPLCLSIAF